MKKGVTKSEFQLLKQILIDLNNLNLTLALMNLNKFFPSRAVKESTERFYENRKEFINEKENEQDG